MKIVAAMVFTLAGSAAHASGIGLLQSWQSAKDHDPALAAARAQLEAGRAQGSMARASWLPTLVATGDAGRSDVTTLALGARFNAPGIGAQSGVGLQTDVDGGNAHHWALVAEQPLLDGERTAQSASYRNSANMAEARYHQAEQDLMVHAAHEYFEVLGARALLAELRALRASAERARGEAQARYAAGDVPVTDMREAQASADAVGVRELDAESAVSLAEAAYAELTGLDPAELGTLPETATVELPAPESLDAWTLRVIGNSPKLHEKALALDTATAQLSRFDRLAGARVSLVVQLEGDSLAGSGRFGSTNSTSRQENIGVHFSLPLFTGGMRSAQRHEARSLCDQARAELGDSVQEVRQQTRSAWLGFTTAAARVEALKRLRLSASSRLDATRLGTEIGSRTAVELLNAEADFRHSGTDFQRAQIDWFLGLLRLKALAGELRDADLAQLDARLGVEAQGITSPPR